VKKAPLYQVFFLKKPLDPDDPDPHTDYSQRLFTYHGGRWIFLADVGKFFPRPKRKPKRKRSR
jgi:hypothetical protein